MSQRNVESMAARHCATTLFVWYFNAQRESYKKQVNKTKNYYDKDHPLSGINTELVSSTIIKKHFKIIDRDSDGKVYIGKFFDIHHINNGPFIY